MWFVQPGLKEYIILIWKSDICLFPKRMIQRGPLKMKFKAFIIIILIIFILLLNFSPALAQSAGEWFEKGEILFAGGKYEEAIDCYDEALEIEPEFGEALLKKGFCLFLMDRVEEGRICLAKLLKICPVGIYPGIDKITPDVINARMDTGETLLHLALRKYYENLALILILYSADINAGDGDGKTPLHTAIEYSYEKGVRLLLFYNANVNIEDNNGYTPLDMAKEKGNKKLVDLLLMKGAIEKVPTLENYIFVKKWGSTGDRDGQFGGSSINSDFKYIITDDIVKGLNRVFFCEKNLEGLQSLENKLFENKDELFRALQETGINVENCLYIIDFAFPEKLENSLDIALDNSGNVYVSDRYRCCIHKFDSEGNFLSKWNKVGDGKFDSFGEIAVDSDGYLYSTDGDNDRIQKFDPDGNFILQWGSNGLEDGEPEFITGIAVSPDNYVYVNREDIIIQKFDVNSNFIQRWIFYSNKFEFYNNYCELHSPGESMAIDNNNNFYILIRESGHPENVFSSAVYPYLRKTSLTECSEICGSEIFGGEECNGIVSFALDTEGNIFVVDSKRCCIYKIDDRGNLLAKWGSFGSDDGEFDRPEEIAVDREGNVYVLDTGNCRIQKFAPVSQNNQL